MKKMKNIPNSTIQNSWQRAAAKGALVWGSVYSTASSAAAYVLAPLMTGSSLVFGDVFMDALVIFPSAGAAQGLIMWQMREKDPGADGVDHFTGGNRKNFKHPIRIKKAA